MYAKEKYMLIVNFFLRCYKKEILILQFDNDIILSSKKLNKKERLSKT